MLAISHSTLYDFNDSIVINAINAIIKGMVNLRIRELSCF